MRDEPSGSGATLLKLKLLLPRGTHSTADPLLGHRQNGGMAERKRPLWKW